MSEWPDPDDMAALLRSAEEQGVTTEMVDACRRVLSDYFDASFGSAMVGDYVHGGMNEAERAAGLAAMRAEDERLAAATEAVVAGALAAALVARDGAKASS